MLFLCCALHVKATKNIQLYSFGDTQGENIGGGGCGRSSGKHVIPQIAPPTATHCEPLPQADIIYFLLDLGCDITAFSRPHKILCSCGKTDRKENRDGKTPSSQMTGCRCDRFRVHMPYRLMQSKERYVFYLLPSS